MRVFFFWERVGGLTLGHKCNPYGPLLTLAMAKRDIHYTLGNYEFDREWLKTNRKDYDVLHFNWVRHFYLADTLEEAIARYNRFTDNLRYAKKLGYRIVWTMHNLYPHERKFPELDHLAHLNMCRIADHVIAHCNYSADLCEKHFHRTDNLHVIPHGNYIDAYPNDVSQEDARQHLDIPESAFVYLFFGNARPYKGIERLITSFQKIENENAVLLLALRNRLFPEYVQKLANDAADDPRIRVKVSEFFEPEDFQNYLNAADVAVLPFVEALDRFFGYNAAPFEQLYKRPYKEQMDYGFSLNRFEGINNESDMETPYTYVYAGRPDRTAEVVRAAMTQQFVTGRGGLPGNDDSGGLSSWYVWSAIGIFPVAGQDIYLIGSPLFDRAELDVNGQMFTIDVRNNSDQNIYVQRAELNGKSIDRAYLRHAELASGATLTLHMDSQPTDWGRNERPPSYT